MDRDGLTLVVYSSTPSTQQAIYKLIQVSRPDRASAEAGHGVRGMARVCFRCMANRVRSRPTEGPRPIEPGALPFQLDRCFRAPLLAYFTKRVKSRSEAEDLTQEVFVRLLNHPDREHGEHLAGYVFTIAANLLRDRAKSVAAAHEKTSQSLDVLAAADVFAPTLVEHRSPERILAGRQTVEDVLAALAELGERTRDIFILARLENMQHREIAALYGISVSAVEKSMMKAMAHLGALFLRP